MISPLSAKGGNRNVEETAEFGQASFFVFRPQFSSEHEREDFGHFLDEHVHARNGFQSALLGPRDDLGVPAD